MAGPPDFPVLGGRTTAAGPGGVSGITADPWRERDRLAQGRPVQITGLAQAFARGAGDAELAAELAQQASRLTAEGYQVDNTPVHQLDEHVAQSRQMLGGSGDAMRRVSAILDGIADDLTLRTDMANRDVEVLESQLRSNQTAWDAYDARYQSVMSSAPSNAEELTQQHTIELNRSRDASVALVNEYGRRIGGSVADYDAELGKRSRDLANMGYVPPDDLAGGPGDVTGDPDAGGRDARVLAGILDRPPSRQTLAEIDAITSDIRILNDKVVAGERLTDAERAYLTQFYETLGAEDLAALPNYVRQGAPLAADMSRDVDGSPVATADDVYRRTLAPFGDSILNLSAVTTDDHGNAVSYEQAVPAPVRELLDTRLGVIDDSTGIRWANDRFLSGENPDPRNPSAYLLGGGIAGLNRYDGITDVLGSSTRTPGTGLARDLADSAIRTRQDLNAVQDTARHYMNLTYGGGTDEAIQGLDRLVDDSSASTALGIAARNNEASSGVLLDADQRASILGLNWEDGTGAAALVASGTERDPEAGGGTPAQAGAALAVVQEVAGDRDGYLGRMNGQVSSAVTDVGMQYLDAFAASPVDHSAVELHRTDAMGREVGPSFELTAEDRDHFLQFVSGTGDDEAATFQAQARVYSQAGIADALANGTPEQVHRALETAGRLDGTITQANFDYTADTVQAQDEEAAAANRAAQIEGRANQGMLNTLAVAAKEGIGLLPGGALVSGSVSILTEIVKGEIGNVTLPPAPPTAQLPQTLEDLRRADSGSALLQRDLLIAGAMDTAGLFGPGERPAILTQDNDGVPGIDSPTSDSQSQDLLGPAVRDGLDEWGGAHAEGTRSGVVDPDVYSGARGTSMSGTYDGAGAPARSIWAEDDRLYYGDSKEPPTPFGARAPDPRLLDDPRYDPLRDELRPR